MLALEKVYPNMQKNLAIFFEKCYDSLTQVTIAFKGGVSRMPNIKSAKKRVRVSATKQARNKSANSALKTAIKKANAAIDANAENKDALVNDAIKKIDQAAAKGLLHKNNAARKKSALMIKAAK